MRPSRSSNQRNFIRNPGKANILFSCLNGSTLSSEGLAKLLDRYQISGTKHLFFYVGGPEGLPKSVLDNADMSLSLSSMVFNHQIVRIMLLEQVYRAFTIIRGEPYHK